MLAGKTYIERPWCVVVFTFTRMGGNLDRVEVVLTACLFEHFAAQNARLQVGGQGHVAPSRCRWRRPFNVLMRNILVSASKAHEVKAGAIEVVLEWMDYRHRPLTVTAAGDRVRARNLFQRALSCFLSSPTRLSLENPQNNRHSALGRPERPQKYP